MTVETEAGCSNCGDEVEVDGGLCGDCRETRDSVPYDVDCALRRLSSAVEDVIGKWQNRGWDTGKMKDAIRDEINDILESM